MQEKYHNVVIKESEVNKMSLERKIVLGSFEVPDVEYVRTLEHRITELENKLKRHITDVEVHKE